mmetsp:Transcript_14738/g.21049  ORF Transcript_14738/g.21049 Transcript_14738/m.21049 type:complete len:399 (-) Transcript_14738:116-1312(-)
MEKYSGETSSVSIIQTKSVSETLDIVSSSLLESLPHDILHKVFEFASIFERTLCTRCNKFFHQFIFVECPDLWECLEFTHRHNSALAPHSHSFSSKLTDRHLRILLKNIHANKVVRKLSLIGCTCLKGTGLSPLKGSKVLRHIDLRTMIIRPKPLLPRRSSIRRRNLSILEIPRMDQSQNVRLSNLPSTISNQIHFHGTDVNIPKTDSNDSRIEPLDIDTILSILDTMIPPAIEPSQSVLWFVYFPWSTNDLRHDLRLSHTKVMPWRMKFDDILRCRIVDNRIRCYYCQTYIADTHYFDRRSNINHICNFCLRYICGGRRSSGEEIRKNVGEALISSNYTPSSTSTCSIQSCRICEANSCSNCNQVWSCTTCETPLCAKCFNVGCSCKNNVVSAESLV